MLANTLPDVLQNVERQASHMLSQKCEKSAVTAVRKGMPVGFAGSCWGQICHLENLECESARGDANKLEGEWKVFLCLVAPSRRRPQVRVQLSAVWNICKNYIGKKVGNFATSLPNCLSFRFSVFVCLWVCARFARARIREILHFSRKTYETANPPSLFSLRHRLQRHILVCIAGPRLAISGATLPPKCDDKRSKWLIASIVSLIQAKPFSRLKKPVFV